MAIKIIWIRQSLIEKQCVRGLCDGMLNYKDLWSPIDRAGQRDEGGEDEGDCVRTKSRVHRDNTVALFQTAAR